DVAVMVWVLADASSAEPPTRPATATAKADAPTRVFRSIRFPPFRHRSHRCRPDVSLGHGAGRDDSSRPSPDLRAKVGTLRGVTETLDHAACSRRRAARIG